MQVILKRVSNDVVEEGAYDMHGSSKVISTSVAKSASGSARNISNRIRPFGDDDDAEDKRKDNEYKFRLEVKDSGAGISPENQKKLFGQYVQFNAGKLQKGNGSGLGLWISKGIIELHEGVLDIYSEGEGTGSTFFVELPLSLRDRDRQQPAKSMWLPTMRNPKIGDGPSPASGAQTTIKQTNVVATTNKGFNRSVRHVKNTNNNTNKSKSLSIPKKKASDSTIIPPMKQWASESNIINTNDPPRRKSSLLKKLASSMKLSSDELQTNEVKENENDNVNNDDDSDDDEEKDDDDGTVPATSVSVTPTVIETSRPISSTPSSAPRCLQIYLVDDSNMSRTMLRRILLTQGHRVSEAVDGIDLVRKMEIILESKKSGKQNEIRGASAVEVTTSLETPYTGVKWDKSLFNIDVILIDDNMPEMSGPVATKVLRHRGYDGMIIGVTGNTLPEDIANFKNHGASHVYSKPLSKEKLTDIFALC